ncbi:hypothetical protein VFPPC_17582 [Pochonia chlamydosporia 170]|uniref:Uncharacterized protein n=1 Tax=Pochonia chlamydosporia 170 TaxID=1380566 RepID=A0A219ASU0_METCM|nr:hypothetical protein VFPPC_17582 [Pochonia chlamydosporia 170]OWT43255.1 hypothetical protein VFPPC_17582 [Pochonia chlamydosporia 170]
MSILQRQKQLSLGRKVFNIPSTLTSDATLSADTHHHQHAITIAITITISKNNQRRVRVKPSTKRRPLYHLRPHHIRPPTRPQQPLTPTRPAPCVPRSRPPKLTSQYNSNPRSIWDRDSAKNRAQVSCFVDSAPQVRR